MTMQALEKCSVCGKPATCECKACGKPFCEGCHGIHDCEPLVRILNIPCPHCGSMTALQAYYDREIEEEVYQCAGCNKWFSESGLIEVEEDGVYIWKRKK